MWVRGYGNNLGNKNIFQSVKDINKNIRLIDDRCLSIPSFNVEHNFQDLTLFSTGYSKFIDYGWGGFGYMIRIIFILRIKILLKKRFKTITEYFQDCMDNDRRFRYKDNDWLGGKKKCSEIIYRTLIKSDVKRMKKLKRRLI